MVVTSSSEPIPNSLPTCLLTWLAPGTQVGIGQKAPAQAPWPLVNCVTLDRSRPVFGHSMASK